MSDTEDTKNSNTSRLVGIGLMLPLAGLVAYMVLNPKTWLIILFAIVFSLMFTYGLKLVKGKSFKEVGKDIIDDIDDLKDDAEEAGKKISGSN